MIKAGIIGGSGYTGGELLRLLLRHPGVELRCVFSTSQPGQPVSSVHPDLNGITQLEFTDQLEQDLDVLFLCSGHGNSARFLRRTDMPPKAKIIDLSSDFRGESLARETDRDYVYGLPEAFSDQIESASRIANPGCFATAITLALLPLAKAGLLHNSIHVHATTGSTGAGKTPSDTTHYSWRNNNLSWYKPFTHQHLGEISATLSHYQEKRGELLFLPMRGNFTRGILATAYTRFEGDIDFARAYYQGFYEKAAFTKLVAEPPVLKQVVNTNYCHLHLHVHDGLLLVTAVLDNLLKGASGQAVQNMNLVFGLEEDLGLQLKASAF